jgi:myb proto-oncogene protein
MDFYSDDSDPDIDEDLQEDLDALRRSCILSGADPDAAVAQVSSGLAGPSTPALAAATTAAPAGGNGFSSDEDDDDEEDEDLALVRAIRENLHRLNTNKASPSLPDGGDGGGGEGSSSPRPICTWPPSDTDEDEDDLETLRAIQRRFSHYQSSEYHPLPPASILSDLGLRLVRTCSSIIRFCRWVFFYAVRNLSSVNFVLD